MDDSNPTHDDGIMETVSENTPRKRGRPRTRKGELIRDAQFISMFDKVRCHRSRLNEVVRLDFYKVLLDMSEEQTLICFGLSKEEFRRGFPQVGLPSAAIEIGRCLDGGLLTGDEVIAIILHERTEKNSWTQIGKNFRWLRLLLKNKTLEERV